MNAHSQQYLEAFIAIEQHLTAMAAVPRGTPFSNIVDTLVKQSTVVRYYADDLKAFARLRNVIVHERGGGQVLAEPNTWAVRRIQHIQQVLLQPPTVATFAHGNVVTITAQSTLAHALHIMAHNHFSQLPVYQERRYVGLLTVRSVTYWIGANIATPLDFTAITVNTVLESAEHRERAHFVDGHTPIVDVVELFATHSRAQGHLDAVLITKDGSSESAVIGIIVAADIPRLIEHLNPATE
jgi:CBS domain-containing protein